MQEFNKVSTISNFIKQLLNTTYLPVIRTISAGDYIVEGRQYLYNCEIINCTKTGFVYPGTETIYPKYANKIHDVPVGEDDYKNVIIEDKKEEVPIAQFVHIGEYRFGQRNGKLCHSFQSNCEGYDSLTHEKLGDYLRALRDMYGLNLMPLYNCFSKNSLGEYHIFTDRIAKTTYNYHTKIYKVPIRFNTDYTVCIENVGITTFAPAFIKNEHLVNLNKTVIGDNIDVTNRYISLHTDTVISSYGGLRFFDPIVIRFNNIPESKTVQYTVATQKPQYTEIVVDEFSSKFFTVFENELTPEEYAQIKDTLYVRSASGLVNCNNVAFNANARYYQSSIMPSDAQWYELDDGTYVLTEDTLIDLDKTYYLKSTEVSTSYYTYDVEDLHCEMYDAIEDTFYMLIQLPESFDSNIVILEGDYRNTQSDKYFNETDLRNYPEIYLDKLFTHDIRLMRMNVQQITPFSDSLPQFLLWHVICNLDTINLDMDRLLESMRNLYMDVDDVYYANYWYFRYRELISNYAKKNQYAYIDDNLGYVTTEVEALLNRK